MKLSIISPALLSRRRTATIYDSLEAQAEGKPVELIVLADNGKTTIGSKMNHLVRAAMGDYISTVADDDTVAPDYVDQLLQAIEADRDVVEFLVDWQAGERFLDWQPSPTDFRPLAAVRRSLAVRFEYPDWWQSEDRCFRVWLKQQKPSVVVIPEILYRYHFKASKPEYGGAMYPPGGTMKKPADVERHIAALAEAP